MSESWADNPSSRPTALRLKYSVEKLVPRQGSSVRLGINGVRYAGGGLSSNNGSLNYSLNSSGLSSAAPTVAAGSTDRC